MATTIEYALLAGASYYDTRNPNNRFSIPQNWGVISRVPQDGSTGFEASAYKNLLTNEIVISYAGTYPTDILGDQATNIGLGTGNGSAQLLQAAAYYLQVKAANPGATIKLTGHSLGGGLASLVGVFFGVEAHTFDQAPFANSASIAVRDEIISYLNTQGYTTPTLMAFVPELFSYDPYGAPSASRAYLVTNISVQGEFLSTAPLTLLSRIGTTNEILNSAAGVSGFDLHAQALLTAFLQSQQTAATGKSLNDVTFKLPDLLKMFFDDQLFDRPTDEAARSFIEHIVRHETGVQGQFAADAMVTRLTKDLWKVAQDGGFTLTNTHIANTLVAFAMQKYYEEPASGADHGKELFTAVSGGIRFDRTDVSASLADAKGWQQYFQNWLAQDLSLEEHRIVLQLLPAATDWFVQSGLLDLNATADISKAFMVGGTGNDWMRGGSQADLLIGNAGDDTLNGGAGNDTLMGGTGYDTYIINAGDGFDTLVDVDGSGVVKLSGVEAKGKAAVTDPAKWIQRGNIWQDQEHGLAYGLITLPNGSQTLIITSLDGAKVEIKGWSAGDLGIDLGAGAQPSAVPTPATTYTIAGDLKPLDHDPEAAGIQEDYDSLGNVIVGSEAAANREDTLYDSYGNDHILGHGGNDTLYAWRGGDDLLEGGAGQDSLSGGAGNDVLAGGTDSDVLIGGVGDDHLFAVDPVADLGAAILAGETQAGGGRGDWLSGDDGIDTLVGGAGNDVLLGGEGEDLLIGGGGNDNIYGDKQGNANINWTLTRQIIQQGSNTTYHTDIQNGGTALAAVGGADVIYGGAGNDWIEGGQGNDIIDAGADDDVVFGGQGADIILGQAGNDILMGNGGVNAPENDGDDYIDGGDGDDVIWGAAGSDTLLGGAGNDQLSGGEDNDILDGGEGDDVLEGNEGEDMLFGGAGNDRLIGGDGNDVLDGGEGDDILEGGAGDDTYLAVTGGDAVFDVQGHNTIVLAAATGLGASGLAATTVTGNDGNPYVQLNVALDDGGTLNLDSPFFASGTGTIQFANGEMLDVETLVAEQLFTPLALQLGDEGGRLYGGAGNDVLLGGAGNDTLIGYGGNDILQGGAGNDIYLGVAGGDTIFDVAGDNTIRLDANGVTAGSVSASVQTNEEGGLYIQLSVGLDTGGVLKLDSPFFSSGTTTLHFKDGSTQDLEALASKSLLTSLNLQLGNEAGRLYGGAGNDRLTGGGGNDTLIGHDGNDLLIGGAGDDVLIGGAGNDHYVLSDGHDTIVETLSNAESNTLSANVALNDVNVALVAETDGSQTLRLTLANGSSVDIRNGFLGAISNVILAGNDAYTLQALLDARMAQGLDIKGTHADDRLFGGAGDDVLNGQDGDDVLSGGAGNDVLIGGNGNDVLLGGGGDDIYIIDSIAGQDYVNDQQGNNVIRFGQNVMPETLTVITLDSGSGSLALYVSGQQIATIAGNLETFRFEFDGLPQMSIEDFLAAYAADPIGMWGEEDADILYGGLGDDVLSGEEGNDILFGKAGNDIFYGGRGDDELIGGPGNDTLNGGLGSDSYYYNLGDGQDVIYEEDWLRGGQTSADRVVFGSGIEAADVVFKHLSNGDLSVTVGGQADALVIVGWYKDIKRRVESFVFSDGTQINAATLAALEVVPTFGTSGNDTLIGVEDADILLGLGGDDLLAGGSGDDQLSGGGGTDTYRFIPGSGNDSVIEVAGETSYIEFYGQDLFRLNGARSADDLVLAVAGASDTVTLKNFYTQPHDWQVKDAYGTTYALTDVLQDNAVRSASLGEMERAQEAFVGKIQDKAIDYFISQGLKPQSDGRWQLFPVFAVERQTIDYERLPGWAGWVPNDSASHSFRNDWPYKVGEFGLSTYAINALETDLDEVWQSSELTSTWEEVATKIEVSWQMENVVDPLRIINNTSGGYRYTAAEWTGILNSALSPYGLSVYDFNFGWVDVRSIGFNGLSNPYTETNIPAYTYGHETTRYAATVISTEASDGTGYDILNANAENFFNIGNLPTVLDAPLWLNRLDYQLKVVEGGIDDNVYLFSGNNTVIIHAGAGNDAIYARTLYLPASERFHFSYGSEYAANMFLDGGTGNDVIESGQGSDLIYGGEGDDVLKGGGGQDRYVFLFGQTGTDLVLDDAHNVDSSFQKWWVSLQNGVWPTSDIGLNAAPRAHDFSEIEAANAYTTEVDWASVYDYGGMAQVIPPDIAEFGIGIATTDLAFAWGNEAVDVAQANGYWIRNEADYYWDSYELFETVRWHQTLDVTWQAGAVARFVLPNPDDIHGFGVELFKFADGTQLTIGQLVDLAGGYRGLIEGTDGDDLLIGTVGTDWMFGFTGNDILYGGDGQDYLFSRGEGSELYGDAGNDALSGGEGNDRLDGGTGDDFMSGEKGDDVYVVDSNLDSVVEYYESGFDTIESSVTYTLNANVESLVLTGNAAINGIGNELDNVLTGNNGTNVLSGGLGNDTYVFGRGFGQDVVDSYDPTVGKLDVVQFDTSVAPEEIIATRSGNDLILSVDGTSDVLTIRNYLENDGITPYAVEQIRFHDGTVWDLDAVKGMLNVVPVNHTPELSQPLPDQTTTAGATFSYTVALDAFSDPDAGDMLTYSATLSDGNPLPAWLSFDTASRTFSGTPAVAGTYSVTVTAKDVGSLSISDVFDIIVESVVPVNHAPELSQALPDQAATEGESFSYTVAADAFTDPDADDTLTYSATLADGSPLPAWLGFDTVTRTFSGIPSGPGTVSVRVTAEDAGELTASDVFELVVAGTAYTTINGTAGSETLNGTAGNDILNGLAGNDVIYGNAGNDIINGGPGNDTLNGGEGNDLFLVEGDSGNDTVNGGDGFDQIVGSAGDDIIRFANYGGANTVERIDGGGGYNRIVAGTNFSTLDFSTTELVNIARIEGGAGDNQITGSQGDDVISGGAGVDTLRGGTGNDTYLLGRGYGKDTVIEQDATAGNTDVAQFLSGVAADQIWFRHIGNDLEASIIGTGDKLVIKDWYLGSDRHVEQFKTTDGGLTLLDSQVENLINAMASFAPPSAGQTTLPQTYQNALAGVIAANWQ